MIQAKGRIERNRLQPGRKEIKRNQHAAQQQQELLVDPAEGICLLNNERTHADQCRKAEVQQPGQDYSRPRKYPARDSRRWAHHQPNDPATDQQVAPKGQKAVAQPGGEVIEDEIERLVQQIGDAAVLNLLRECLGQIMLA